MFLLTTIEASPSLLNNHEKSHSTMKYIYPVLNLTNESIKNNINSSLNKLRSFDNSLTYTLIRDGSNLTKTQMKVILTVVIVISFIMFIMAIFRFKNACRDQEANRIQVDIIRHRALKYSEPSSNRGSIAYYTRKYNPTPGIYSNERLNTSLSIKRFSNPTGNYSSRATTTAAIPSSLPVESLTPESVATATTTSQNYVTSSCKTSNNTYASIPVKPIVRKSFTTIGINKLPVAITIITIVSSFSLTILSIHCQSRRLILCTVPPHILCRPNTVRYSLVFHVHDQRQRRHRTSNRYIKVSSPTLRKLCLPCITTRNNHHNRQQSNRTKTSISNQQQIINSPTTTVAAASVTNISSENNIIVSSSHRFEVAPRTYHSISTTPVVHSSEYLQENDSNHFQEQQQDFEASIQNRKIEEKNNEISVEAEVTPTKVVLDSKLLTSSPSPSSSSLSPVPGNEITRSIENDTCDDQTPLLTSELASTIKDSTDRNSRKYSLNAISPLSRSPNSHPLFPSSTTKTAFGSQNAGDDNKGRNRVDLEPRRRISFSSALCRSSIAKQAQNFEPIIDSACEIKTISTKKSSLPINNTNSNNHPSAIDSDSGDRTSLLKSTKFISKNPLKKKTSSITPVIATYRKDFMQRIERIRFIDDSASSTTTVTSPVESVDRLNSHQPSNHLITSAIEQFDDYIRSRYDNNDEINSYIDRLDSDIIKNGTYSDLNILNSTNDNNIPIQNSQQSTVFKPVKNLSSDLETVCDYRQTMRNSTPIRIPPQTTKHTYQSDISIPRPTTIITNGHSRSMDFQSIHNNNSRHELLRPIVTSNTGTIYETSSSSTATLISARSSNSIEFDDDSKPSGVLVDDDFLPMSSPVDDHFWDMTQQKSHHRLNNNNNNDDHHQHHKKECFPNVGSSPDVEVKHFGLPHLNTLSSSLDQPLSETSCDEDDDSTLLNQQKFSIHEYKLKELQRPIVIHRSLFNPSIRSTEQIHPNNDLISIPIRKLSLEKKDDESLLEKFASANSDVIQIPIRSPPLRTSTTNDIILSTQPHPQTIYEEDDTQSSTNDNGSDESADNGEIDLVHEFELSQNSELNNNNNNNNNNDDNLWHMNDRDVFMIQENDLLSALVTTPTQSANRSLPPSIMKITQNKSLDIIDEQQTPTMNILRPKVRFNLDPQYEREREWNKVNKLLGNSVEWTDEFEV
ncbi:unnamed protein product [Rotaria magnacalcarata]|uniref:Uncharacterized protein n=1 Tax=Rotaria magnacalcarata TaxID=392030 RepID=A0A816PZ24_9BILA|nr:unnamed protein product [Rotaria magnacalcarata]